MATSQTNSPLITEEADRVLGRIILRYGAVTFVLLVATTALMSFVNVDDPRNHLFRWHRPLDLLSILIPLIPFFLGMNRLFAARLRLGRDLVQRRQWKAAVAALDPFAGPTQRFLDGTGEAHYLLVQAYAGAGETAKAAQARTFLQRHRPGPWADKLAGASPAAKPGIAAIRAQEKAKRPTNVKRRRRF